MPDVRWLAAILMSAPSLASACVLPGAGAYHLSPIGVVRVTDGATIPADTSNTDWLCYRAWVAAGNTSLPAPVPAALTTITAIAFFGRFTDAERVAVQTAVNASPQLGVGLVNGLAAGQINLLDPIVKAWMDGLVSAGAITADRESVILTP